METADMMARLFRKSGKKAGSSPGTLVHVGERKAESVRITVMDYDEGECREREAGTVAECVDYKASLSTTWINIDGLHQVEVMEQAGEVFGLHPLVLEDVMNTQHQPKVEEFDEYIFVVLKMLTYDEEADRVRAEQISLVLGERYVLSFQESVGDVFGPVRKRLKSGRVRIRKSGPDYLMYALMDCIVDHYYVVLEKLANKIESLQETVASDPSEEALRQIHELKHELIYFRKAVWPVREMVNSLTRMESSLVREETEVFFRDVYDHAVQVIDAMETYREMIGGMQDIYLSSISNRMNAVMKVLTIIATIFIPLTFIAGVYGMNFEYMPELGWHWAYPVVWGVMLGVTVVMLVYFRRKRWI